MPRIKQDQEKELQSLSHMNIWQSKLPIGDTTHWENGPKTGIQPQFYSVTV